jgi:hypothetical protein
LSNRYPQRCLASCRVLLFQQAPGDFADCLIAC